MNILFAQALYLATSDTVYLQTVVSSMLKEERKLQQVMEDLFVPKLEGKVKLKELVLSYELLYSQNIKNQFLMWQPEI